MNNEVFSQPTTDDLRKSIRSNRRIIRLSRNWLKFALAFFFIYTGLSLLPPFLMQAGLEGPATIIHKIYSPMCHQFSFRSWFFFGEQAVYPRAVSGTHLGTFEAYAASDPHFGGIDLDRWSVEMQMAARSFTGNEHMGYKTALCERDVLIYGTMFLIGLLFARVRRWLRPAPVWLYLILGLAPMGLDGFSQMFSYPPFEYWPVRETLPEFRVLTGFLFGMMNVWLAFPHLEKSMMETADTLERKVALAEHQLRALGAGD